MNCEVSELKNRQIINFFIEDRYRILRHSGFLIGLLVLLYNSKFPHEFSGVYKYYITLFVYVIFIVMFYINMYVLVPAFFFKAKYLSYIVLLVALVFIGLSFTTYIVNSYKLYRIITNKIPIARNYYEAFIIIIPITLLTTTIKIFQRWIKDSKRIAELNSLTLSMELNGLKNQINPHFLFNMLNNVRALVKRNPEKASAVIMKLSEFLRYQLYENNEEKTPLTSELKFLSNFMELEKTRRDNLLVNIHCDADIRVLNNIFIPPNLFTTFAENAVKHSTDIRDKEAHIKIEIGIENKNLHFVCSNSKGSGYLVTDKKYSGLGLANIKRRLDLLYQDRYKLDITPGETEYSVSLTIPI